MAADYFNIPPDHIIVISDDISFPLRKDACKAKGFGREGITGLKV